MALKIGKKSKDTPPPAPAETEAALIDPAAEGDPGVDPFALATPETNGVSGKAKKVKRERVPKSKGTKNGVMVGLNIGNTLIKAVEVTSKGGELSITAMGAVPTPPESLSNGVVMSVNALASALKELWRQGGFKSRNVTFSVAGTGALVVRVIEVPKMTDGELRDNMKVDADRYIPFPPSEVVMDFKALRDLPTDPDAPNMEVLLAAAQREIIDLHIKVVQKAKLEPRSIDVEPIAATRALDLREPGADTFVDYGEVTALINIGATGTEISVLRGDIVVFTRTVPTGGNAITQAISDTLGLPFFDAERIKIEQGDALPPHNMPSAPGANEFTDFGLDGPTGGADFGGENASDTVDFGEFGGGDSAPAAPTTDDPFDLDFFNQGPQAEPGAGHGQKEGEPPSGDAPSFSFSDFDFGGTPAPPAPAPTGPPTEGAPADTSSDFDFSNFAFPSAETAAPAEATPSAAAPAPAPPKPASTPPAPTVVSGPAGPFVLNDLAGGADQDIMQAPIPSIASTMPGFDAHGGLEMDDFSMLPTVTPDAPAVAPFDPAGALVESVAPPAPQPGEIAGDDVLPALSTTPGETTPSAFEFRDFDLPTVLPAGSAPVAESSVAESPAPAAPAPSAPTLEIVEPVAPVVEVPPAPSKSAFSFDEDVVAAPVSIEPAPALEMSPAADAAFSMDAFEAPTDVPPVAAPIDPFAETFSIPMPAAPTPAGGVADMAPVAAPAATGSDFDLDSIFGPAPGDDDAEATENFGADLGNTVPVATDDVTDVFGGGDFDLTAPDTDDEFGFGGLGSGLGGLDDVQNFGAGLGGAEGAVDAATLYTILHPILDELIGEVRRSLEYHLSRYPDATITKLTLIGGGAGLLNLDYYFTQMLGIPTVVGNPFGHLSMRAPKLPPDYVADNGPICTVALGLALRDFV